MNFKDSYQKENESIQPDKHFLQELAVQMEEEKRAVYRKKKLAVSVGSLAAAAAVCAVVVNIGFFKQGTEQQNIVQKAEMAESTTEGHSFGVKVWYGDADTAEEIMDCFQTLLSEENIKALYCSEMEEYTEENRLSEEESKELAARLTKAEAVAEEEAEELAVRLKSAEQKEEETAGSCQYYMLVFENGDIVKFEIYGEMYLKLKECEGIFLL